MSQMAKQMLKAASQLQSLKNICSYKIRTENGDIGHVEDFYFDIKSWTTRYLVAHCGNWVMGRRKVLIAPEYFDHTDQTEGRLYLNLTQEQVEVRPTIETQTPISKQHLSNKIFTPGSPEYRDKAEEVLAGRMMNPEDEYLYSFNDTEGLTIEALDGGVGHMADFMVNDETWDIILLVVNTRNWLPSNFVMITTDRIQRFDWPTRRIYLNITCQEVKDSPK